MRMKKNNNNCCWRTKILRHLNTRKKWYKWADWSLSMCCPRSCFRRSRNSFHTTFLPLNCTMVAWCTHSYYTRSKNPRLPRHKNNLADGNSCRSYNTRSPSPCIGIASREPSWMESTFLLHNWSSSRWNTMPGPHQYMKLGWCMPLDSCTSRFLHPRSGSFQAACFASTDYIHRTKIPHIGRIRWSWCTP